MNAFAPLALFAGSARSAFGAYNDADAAPPVIVGVLDEYTTNLAGAWSVGRRLLGSYTGALIRVRESGGDTEADIGYDAEGNLDETALLAHCGANDGYLRYVYDQSGGTNHLLQETDEDQLKIVSAGVLQTVAGAGKPMGTIITAAVLNLITTNTVTGAYSIYVVARNSSIAGGYGMLLSLDTNSGFYDLGNTTWEAYGDGFSGPNALGNQTTWACHFMGTDNAGGTDMTLRSDVTQQVIAGPATPGNPLVLGGTDISMQFTEAAVYSTYHGGSTITAVQAILKASVLPLLALVLATTVDSAIAGQTPSVAKPLFSTLDHSTPSYVWNADGWGFSFLPALTAVSVWNSAAAGQKAGVLISPRHVLWVKHYHLDIGDTMRWVKADGTVVTRTVSNLEEVTEYTSSPLSFPDLCIGLLDSDVPAGIEFARVLPDNWTSYLEVTAAARIPTMYVDQEKKLLTREIQTLPDAFVPPTLAFAVGLQPVNEQRFAFFESTAPGDSGSPWFVMIDGKLVLLSLFTSGMSGTPTQAFHTEINAAMTSLGGGYNTLTDIDLSGYATI